MPITRDSAASAVVMKPSVLPPPPYPPPAAQTVMAKEGVRLEGLPYSIDPTKPPKNFKDASSLTAKVVSLPVVALIQFNLNRVWTFKSNE